MEFLKTLTLNIVKLIIKQIYNKEVFKFIETQVELYLFDNTLSSEQKREIILSKTIYKAESIGIDITKGSINLIIEMIYNSIK